MVLLILLAAGIAVVLVMLGAFGNLPETPAWLVSTSDNVLDLILWPVYIFQWIIGAELFFGSLAVCAIVMAWEPLYHTAIWIAKKIPMLGIK